MSKGMAETLVGGIILGIAGVSAVTGAVVVGGIWGVSKLVGSSDTVVGVRLTEDQQLLRKNGAVCDEYLTQAFTLAKQQNKVVDLKLPANPVQNCPKP